ncbi:MAG: site-specific DNA-methyltransferase [Bacteroidetes bacterium]|nr:site-specific DNA-methyltransferase [Bacteroidota bacterium]
MTKNLLDDLTELLATEEEFVADGVILRNKVVEAALAMNWQFLELLMRSPRIKTHFFIEVSGILVFDKVKFRDFISHKSFLPDSYTAFRNRIGLTDEHDNHLSCSQNVVLTWAHKDCVLEGGMTKEDRGRDEVFWNTILSPDQITRLYEPKVLTGWERWSYSEENGVVRQSLPEVNEDDNLLIKGNNLLALHSLTARYAGKVKLIYIDPPYNTGNDGFKYNDSFNHCSWLTFMQNRLEVAKILLSRDGIIVVQINDKEQAYLKVLMDEIYDKNYRATVAVKMSHLSGVKMSHKHRKIPKTIEYLHIYSSFRGPITIRPQYVETSWEDAFNRYQSYIVKPDDDPDDFKKWVAIPLREAIKKAKIIPSDIEAKQRFLMSNSECIFRTAVNRSKQYPKEPKNSFLKINNVFVYNGEEVEIASNKIREINGVPKPVSIVGDIWTDIGINNVFQEGGKDIVLRFGKKPEMLLERIIRMFTDEGDLVLDFFAGTGTTAAVAHKLRRRWIAIEQLDDHIDQILRRMKGVINGDQTGISKSASWKFGGAFFYTELAEFNLAISKRIELATNYDELVSIKNEMKNTGFLRYNVDLDSFDLEELKNLSLEESKNVLRDCLDANHLYINLNSIEDEKFQISHEDIRMNQSFYST